MKKLLWLPIIALSGCAAFTEQPSEPQQESIQTLQAAQKKEYPTRPFETDTLYNLLVAEVAGHRSQYDLALENYLAEARNTQDPWVAARAARIAQYLNDTEAAAEAAEIWREQDQENIHAHVAAATNWLKQHKIVEAMSAINDALEISPAISLEQVYLSGKELPEDKQTLLINELDQLIVKYPKHDRLIFTKALLLDDYNKLPEALEAMNELAEITELTPPHYIMIAKVYAKMERPQESRDTLKDGWNAHLGDKTLGLLYSQTLIDEGKPDQARDILTQLRKSHPSDHEILITSAMLEAELGNNAEAKALFTEATKGPQRDSAWHFLGRIYEQEQQLDKAINAYENVTGGQNYISSLTRAITLTQETKDLKSAREYARTLHSMHPQEAPRLIQIEAELVKESGDLASAKTLYDEALTLEPQDSNLLYGRAMLAEQMNNLEAMEKDLRTIIQQNPKNSIALNALGYTLADRTDRLDEALKLIEKAFILNPNDPAVIDSLGWVHYKKGNLKEAEALLTKAFSLFPDQEVAAHLGEVLWVQNKKNDAIKVWVAGLKQDPNGKILLKTLKKYGVDVTHTTEEQLNQQESQSTPKE